MQLFQCIKPQSMDFIRTAAGGGARAQGPGVELVAMRPRPESGVRRCKGALGRDLGTLPLERRDNGLGDELADRDPMDS